MEAMEAILSRRSIRKYTSDPVTDDLVTDLLKAAMSAASTSYEKPWHFIVMRNHTVLDQIPKLHPYSGMLKEAALAIIVCGDLKLTGGLDLWIQICSAATENILIAANSMGLGAVWLGVHSIEERVAAIQKLLELPQHIVPFSIVSIGYPAETKPFTERYDPTRVHYEKW
jgi:nitroreductase